QIDTIFYGRKSYEQWGQYSPSSDASEEEIAMWDSVHSKEKYVFSRTQSSDNDNAIFIHDHIVEEVNKIKNKPGKDIWLYGGASLFETFIQLELVDEYRLSVHPVILGEGKPLFTGITDRINVKLKETKTYSSGVVQLIYSAWHQLSSVSIMSYIFARDSGKLNGWWRMSFHAPSKVWNNMP